MLKVTNLSVNFGGITAIDGISFEVPKGKIISLIGANGAGKSTTLRTVVGLEKARSGSVVYDGNEILGKSVVDIVKSGVVLVPEGRRVFANLSVKENLIMGAYNIKSKPVILDLMKYVFEVFPRLEERQWQEAGTLSGGEQQMLAVGRALMTKPKLIMMDEPSLGLAPLIVKDILQVIQRINEGGVTVLLIEQNAKAALEISDYAFVLETGRVTMHGTGKELANNEDVKKAYLGEEAI